MCMQYAHYLLLFLVFAVNSIQFQGVTSSYSSRLFLLALMCTHSLTFTSDIYCPYCQMLQYLILQFISLLHIFSVE